jgi:hypothetical protein
MSAHQFYGISLRDKRPIRAQVRSGLWLSAKLVFGFVTVTLLLGGLQYAVFPNKLPRVSSVHRVLVFGWISLLTATAIMIATIKTWVNALPGLCGYAAWGGLIVIASGHLSGSLVPVPRVTAILLTLYCLGGAVLSSSFTDRDLGLLDRSALMVFAFSLALSMMVQPPVLYGMLGAGLWVLLLAWIFHRLQGELHDRA